MRISRLHTAIFLASGVVLVLVASYYSSNLSDNGRLQYVSEGDAREAAEAAAVSANLDSRGHRFVHPAYHHRRYNLQGIRLTGDRPLFPACTAVGEKSMKPFGFVGPFPYIKASKNPCWYEREGLAGTWLEGAGQDGVERKGTTLLCVPYFFLAGVGKSGTGDLFYRITNHPDFINRFKEMHWFDRERYIGLSLVDYTKRFSLTAAQVEQDIRDHNSSVTIAGDGSPSYLWDNRMWQEYTGNEGCREPRTLLAHHIRHLNPDAKIILVLRDPTQRLYSRYLANCSKNKTQCPKSASPESFHEVAAEAVALYNDCFTRSSHRTCAYNVTLQTLSRVRLQAGLYSVYVTDWLRVFPSRQIHVMRTEDYGHDVMQHLHNVFKFLDLSPVTQEQFEWLSTLPRRNLRKSTVKEPMLARTRRMLDDFYRPFNQRLAAMLRDHSFLWLPS